MAFRPTAASSHPGVHLRRGRRALPRLAIATPGVPSARGADRLSRLQYLRPAFVATASANWCSSIPLSGRLRRRIRLQPPRLQRAQGQRKGQVENFVRYVKKLPRPGRELPHGLTPNLAARQWLDSTSPDVRLHKETLHCSARLFALEAPSRAAANRRPPTPRRPAGCG